MKTRIIASVWISALITVPLLAGMLASTQAEGVDYPSPGPTRFLPLHIVIDPAGRPLGAYQFELKARAGRIRIVGVEGGLHPAFKKPPYYDPAALSRDRIIIAAYSVDDSLPTTRVRVATVHVQVLGDIQPGFVLTLVTAADNQGQSINAQATLELGSVL